MVKEGTHFDLPIALGLLIAMGVVSLDAIADSVVLGELALDRSLTGTWCVASVACRCGVGSASNLSGGSRSAYQVR